MGVLSCSAHGFREYFHSRVVISLENGQLWRWQSLSIHRCAYLQSSKLVDDFTVIQVDVERVEHVTAQFHGKEFLDRLLGYVPQARLLPGGILIENPKHLVSVAQFFGHDSEDREFGFVTHGPVERETVLLNRAIAGGHSVMFEGAQGTMLDIDHGTYPFVTSSSATSGGAVIGTGVAPTAIDSVIGVTKAYCTRVGEGPFPTEVFDAVGDLIRKRGNEFGAVTGRPRRCGWLDLPLLRYSGMINGTSWLVVTKLDVLDELKEIPVCVGYKIDGKASEEIPAEACGWDRIECVYRTMPGWHILTQGITELKKLPKAAREYLDFVEKESGARIGMVSTGPGREETIFVDEFAAELKALSGGGMQEARS
jgi:hypothetical protein